MYTNGGYFKGLRALNLRKLARANRNEKIALARKHYAASIEGAGRVKPVLRALKKAGASLENVSVYSGMEYGWYVSLYERDVDSLKDGKVPALLEAVEAAVPGGKWNPTSDYADESMASRTFTYLAEGVKVEISAALKGDGPLCHRVKVGERLVPEFKLVCEDEEPAIPA
jgi:hypothetical protein